jgi:tetratricopeptide (TPR) repeat protein
MVVAGPLVLFGLLEGMLRLTGFGYSPALFVADEEPGYFRTNADFARPFFPVSLDIRPLEFRLRREKPADTVRIFLLGESAAQGTPEPGFGMAAQVRAELRAAFPQRNFEVWNLGITGVNSHVVRAAARDAADFAPDLFVVYAGNNEVIGPYGPGSVYLARMPPLPLIRASIWLRGLRTGQLLQALLARVLPGVAAPAWRGMETFSRAVVSGDDLRLDAVTANFAENLRDIVSAAEGTGAKVVLATVVSNLRDCPPFRSQSAPDLGGAPLAAWQAARDRGLMAWYLGDLARAEQECSRALGLNPHYAETHYLLGRLAEARGETAAARRWYGDALRWDALRFRPAAAINETVRSVTRERARSVRLADVAQQLGGDPAGPGPIAGEDLLFEHVHLNWNGNRQVSHRLAEACAQLLFPGSTPAWPGDAAVAQAVGYSAAGELAMQYGMAALTSRPPFTGQLDYAERQEGFRRRIEAMEESIKRAGGTAVAVEALSEALRRDPGNPEVMLRLADALAEHGDHARALAQLDAAAALLPRSAIVDAKRARMMVPLGRANEAVETLQAILRREPEYFPAGEALVDIWSRTREFGRGHAFFDAAVQRAPGDLHLLVQRGNLRRASGRVREAEADWLVVLEREPGNRAALEQLVRSMTLDRRQEEAAEVMLRVAGAQEANFKNNLRLAQLLEARGDMARAVEFWYAMARSGPVDAGFRIELARRLHGLGRKGEMALELARARHSAVAAGAAAQVEAIDQLLANFGPDR